MDTSQSYGFLEQSAHKDNVHKLLNNKAYSRLFPTGWLLWLSLDPYVVMVIVLTRGRRSGLTV
jgi:hypothetical protein